MKKKYPDEFGGIITGKQKMPTAPYRGAKGNKKIPIRPNGAGVATKTSDYVISNEQGQPYTTHGIATLFIRACQRAKVEGITLKDIRSKAATDAIKKGCTEEQLKVSLAHTDIATTKDYIKNKIAPVNEIVLELPGMGKTK